MVSAWAPGILSPSLPFLALQVAVIVLSSGQSGLTESQLLQILLAGDLRPTQRANILRTAMLRAEFPGDLPVRQGISPLGDEILIESSPYTCKDLGAKKVRRTAYRL